MLSTELLFIIATKKFLCLKIFLKWQQRKQEVGREKHRYKEYVIDRLNFLKISLDICILDVLLYSSDKLEVGNKFVASILGGKSDENVCSKKR